MSGPSEGRVIGRYALFDALATGGMATVHFGRLLGPVGFARTVAIKRLHPQYASDPEFVSMFLDEARMCARIRHPNVVPTLDVVATQGELFLVMEYVQGESLGHLLRALSKRREAVPWRVAISIVAGALRGLHAAHEAKDERGLPLSLVHRDVSPQNILVGVDGMARVLDFGIAKATGRLHVTRENAVKGKVGYMAPEQMTGAAITRQADVYAAAVVLWEALTGRRLFEGETEAVVLSRVLAAEVKDPSELDSSIPKELDVLVKKGLSREPETRFGTAKEFAHALEQLGPASLTEVGEFVESVAGPALEKRSKRVAQVETELTPSGERPLLGGDSAPPGPEETSGSRSTPDRIEEPYQVDAAVGAPPRRKQGVIVAGALAAGLAISLGVWALAGRSSRPTATATPTSAAPSAAPASRSATETPAALAPVAATASAPASVPEASASLGTKSPVAVSAPKPFGSAPKPPPKPSSTQSVKPPSTGSGKSPFDLGGRN